MGRSLPHYLNDQCIRILRNLPYPIRHAVRRFPSIATSVEKKSVVAVLCGPRQFLEGLWSLWSWMNHLNPFMGAVLIFDGKATHRQQILFQKLFPNVKLMELDEFLKQRRLPGYMQRFVAGNWTAKKLAAIYELQKETNVLYSDCDVLAFIEPVEIISAITSGNSLFLFDEFGYTVDQWLSVRAEKLGIPVNRHFNAGLVYVPNGGMKETLLEAILHDWEPSFNSHHAEQTLFSILLDPKTMCPLPQNRYVLSWQGFRVWERDLGCGEMVARHYIGPVRHQMYLTAYPWLNRRVSGMNIS